LIGSHRREVYRLGEVSPIGIEYTPIGKRKLLLSCSSQTCRATLRSAIIPWPKAYLWNNRGGGDHRCKNSISKAVVI